MLKKLKIYSKLLIRSDVKPIFSEEVVLYFRILILIHIFFLFLFSSIFTISLLFDESIYPLIVDYIKFKSIIAPAYPFIRRFLLDELFLLNIYFAQLLLAMSKAYLIDNKEIDY